MQRISPNSAPPAAAHTIPLEASPNQICPQAQADLRNGLSSHALLLAKKYQGQSHFQPLNEHDLQRLLNVVSGEILGFACLALYQPSHQSAPHTAGAANMALVQNIGASNIKSLFANGDTRPVSVLWGLSKDNANPRLLRQSARYIESTIDNNLFEQVFYFNQKTSSFSQCHPIGLAVKAVEIEPENRDNWLALLETLTETDQPVVLQIEGKTYDIDKSKCREQIDRLCDDHRNIAPMPSPEPQLLRQTSPLQNLVREIEADPYNIDLWTRLKGCIGNKLVVVQLEGNDTFTDAEFCKQTLEILQSDAR